MSSLLLWVITIVLFSLGLLGVFVPALPGVAFVFAGVLLYAFATEFTQIGVTTVAILGAVALLAWMIEYLGAVVGAKAGGGGKYTMLGTIAGAMLGLILGGPWGLLAGVVLGAMAGSLYEGKTPEKAGQAALFSVVGMVGAKVVQAVMAVMIIIIFIFALIF